jgi:hypothetical protein
MTATDPAFDKASTIHGDKADDQKGPKHGSEKLGPDGQPVPALNSTSRTRPRVPPSGSDLPATPGDAPEHGKVSSGANTGPQISERPMPAQSDK